MKFIVTLVLILAVIYQANKFINNSDKSIVEFAKDLTLQRIVMLVSIVWFIFAFVMIDPFNRVDAWDNVLIVAVLPIILLNGILWILKNHKE